MQPCEVTAVRRAAEPTGLGWSLLSLAWTVPWLIGIHAQPWTTFYNDWLMAFGIMPLAIWVAWRQRGQPWPLDRLALGVLLVAIVPAGQAAAGLLLFAQDGLIVALQLLALAVTIVVARRSERDAPDKAADALHSALLCAAVVSAGLALYQRFDLTYLGMLVEPLPASNRPVANVGQPNQLAMLLNWGLLALWWAFDHRRIDAPVALACACFLLFGIAVTQSRAGVVCALSLAVAAVAFRRLEGRRLSIGAVGLLAGSFVATIVFWPSATQDLMLDKGLTLADQANIGRRPQIWQQAVHAIVAQPWFGFGWNQGTVAQQAVALLQPPLHLVVGHAHNLMLDLMIWNGVPIGAACFVALVVWFAVRVRGLRNQRDAVAWLLPAVLLIYAMVELPHAHMMFLVPAAMSMGLLNQRLGVVHSAYLRDGAARLVVAGLAVAALLTFIDYRRIESDLMAMRLRAAHIGNAAPTEAPTTWVLGQLEAVLRTLRAEPSAGMATESINEMRRTASRYPSAPNLFRYAKAAALNGAAGEAQRALALLCSVQPAAVCAHAVRAWEASANDDSVLKGVELPRIADPSR